MVKGFEHLNDAQLEHYGTESFTVTSDDAQRIDAHLEECADCRSRVLEHQRAWFAFMAETPAEPSSKFSSTPGSASVSTSASTPGSKSASASDSQSTSKSISTSGSTSSPMSGSSSAQMSGASSPQDLTNQSPSADPYRLSTGACTIPNGPSEDDLRNLAAGIIVPVSDGDKNKSQDKALEMTQHVAQCAHCARILRTFTEDFSDDLTPQEVKAEHEFHAQLKSLSPKWQKDMANLAMKANRGQASAGKAANEPAIQAGSLSTARAHDRGTSLATAARSRIFGWPFRRVLAPTAIAASALIAFGLWFTQRDTPEKVEKLLAQAYTEQRTMEYRWPGAEWGPVRVTRGAGQSSLSRPTSQLEAEKILAEHQASTTKDPNWLTAKAEAEMLDNEPQLAITDLTQALSANPGSSDIELMLAIAYAQQGDRANDTSSREKALEMLNKILRRKTVANPAVLFNRALIYQRLNMPEQAIADLTELLEHEPQSRWADAARTKLAELKH